MRKLSVVSSKAEHFLPRSAGHFIPTTDADLFNAGQSLDFGPSAGGLYLVDAASTDDDDIDEAETENWNEFLRTV